MKPKLILVDPDVALCHAFQEHFDSLPNVEIVQNYFQRLPAFDCMVSAANSFGLMDGGVDAAITRFFGLKVMDRVQKRIIEDYFGEQPVGTSIIVETDHPDHPYVAHTPTMRVPMSISKTDNVYLAMWAMLRAVHHHNQQIAETGKPPIKNIACPGLGTGAGDVPYAEAARQMAAAYSNFLNPPEHITWGYASNRQRQVRYGGDFGFDLPQKGT